MTSVFDALVVLLGPVLFVALIALSILEFVAVYFKFSPYYSKGLLVKRHKFNCPLNSVIMILGKWNVILNGKYFSFYYRRKWYFGSIVEYGESTIVEFRSPIFSMFIPLPLLFNSFFLPTLNIKGILILAVFSSLWISFSIFQINSAWSSFRSYFEE